MRFYIRQHLVFWEARLRRLIPSLAPVAVLVAVLAAALPAPAQAAIAPVEEAMAEMVLGAKDAPVTIIEYSSLGCPHCAAFHRDVLPALKKEYIDPGKVRLVYRDFPLGTPALAAAMIARCAGPRKFFGFIEIIFRSQAQWSSSRDPLAELTKVARFGGMSAADVDACLKVQPLLDSIRQGKDHAYKNLDVNSTPTFLIGSHRINGNVPLEDFKKAIDKALGR